MTIAERRLHNAGGGEVSGFATVIASEAKQSSLLSALDCRVAALLAMTAEEAAE